MLKEPTLVIDLEDDDVRGKYAALAREGTAPDDGGVVRQLVTASKVKQIGERQLAWIVSTANEDRDRDVVDPKGGDWAPWLKGGGPVMWAHNYRIPPYNVPIANGVSMELVEGSKLRSVADFGEAGVYDFGDLIFELARPREGRMPRLRQASIGFQIKEWSFDEDRGGFNISQYEGLEWSVVPIASNRDALSEVKALSEVLDDRLTAAWRSFAEFTLETMKGPGLWVSREDVEATYRAIGRRGATLPVPVPAPEPSPAPPDPEPSGGAAGFFPTPDQLRAAVRSAAKDAVQTRVSRELGRLD